MSAITDLAAKLAGLNMTDDIADIARQRLFDTLACFAHGAASVDGQLMLRLTQAVMDTPSTGDLIRYACASTRCTEVDDIHIGSCNTVGSMVVPVAVLAGEALQAGDRHVLEAIVAGYEAMIRLGLAVDGAINIYTGTWTTYLTAPFGAAATVARLAALDEEGTAHALAIAATRCTGMTAQIGGRNTSRWLTAGCAAHDGWLAGRAAALGLLGDPNVLERSFSRSTGVSFSPQAFAGEWERWLIRDVDTKPFRTGRQGLSAVEAYLRLIEGRSPEELETVSVRVPVQVRAMLDHPKPDPNRLALGLQYQLATLSFDPDARWAAGHSTLRDDPRVHALAAKITLLEDERLTALYPRRWGAVVQMTWRNGQAETLEVLDPRGSARNAYGWPELLEKHARVSCGGHAAEPPDWLARLHDVCREFGHTANSRQSAALCKLLPGLH